ncbi:hypothetical protein [Flexibacterium corallicola]|uniref:hypothetical protein n=1 Tax=Flexibacterium corallicola TaxID=3037259 RepID=UPI00286FA3CD|nr:hypothetical protein [Pseudovibrio sp. M1P-2-3]
MHLEAKTFDTKRPTSARLALREEELEKPDTIGQIKIPRGTLGVVIDRYVAEHNKEMRKTKAQIPRVI